MVFLNLRQRIDSIQALLVLTPEKVSKHMLKWAAGLQTESIVLAEGVVKKSPEPIKSATVSDVELHLTQVSRLAPICIPRFRIESVFHGIVAAPYFRLGHQAAIHRG